MLKTGILFYLTCWQSDEQGVQDDQVDHLPSIGSQMLIQLWIWVELPTQDAPSLIAGGLLW